MNFPQQYSCRKGKPREICRSQTLLNEHTEDGNGSVFAPAHAEVYSSMSLCMAASICMFLYCMDDCVCEEGGLGGRSEITKM